MRRPLPPIDFLHVGKKRPIIYGQRVVGFRFLPLLDLLRHLHPPHGYSYETFRPFVQKHPTLMAALISQATNLGVVSMSASVKDTTVDMLRHVLHDFVREETLTAASAEIVNRHHKLPLSSAHGTGTLSSSDAQRFGIRASSLLASYYPRYYGYYEKAIGIYTHMSDQYSVFSTKVISCSPREALYVLDGLLENNTILHIGPVVPKPLPTAIWMLDSSPRCRTQPTWEKWVEFGREWVRDTHFLRVPKLGLLVESSQFRAEYDSMSLVEAA